MKNRYSILLLIGLLLFMGGCKEETPAAAQLRAEISSENPLFVFNVYGWADDQVQWISDNLPDDVRANWAIQFVSLTEDSQQNREGAHRVLSLCDKLGFKAFIQVEHCMSHSDVPSEFLTELFEQHEMLIGLVVAEFSAANTSFYGMDLDHVKAIKRYIDVVVPQGGFFMWQDMGYEFKHPFSVAGSDPGLYEKLTQNKDHIILVDKHNGRSKRFVGPASAMGFYAADLAGNWGPNSEDWIWWEAGLGPLFKEPVGITKAHRMWESVFTYPEALFGTEWLQAAAGGASVYSLECPFHGFAEFFGSEKSFTPAWHNVLLPLTRKLIHDEIIPSREEVREKMKVAYKPACFLPKEYADDELFQGLYGPEESSLYEWLASTGRYFYLPILPELAGDETSALFENIITTADYAAKFEGNQAAKRAYFDEIYPEISKGDSWVVKQANNWFLANPNENRDVATSFDFELSNGASLAGTLSTHAYGIVTEQADQLNVYLSNFRIDTDQDIWSYTDDSFDLEIWLNATLELGGPTTDLDLTKYVDNMIDNYTPAELRQSSLALDCASAPQLKISGTPAFKYETRYIDGRFEIDIWHNGQVDLQLIY